MNKGKLSLFSLGGNWKFGLKDLAISSGKTGISTKYPLEGKDYFHANNCDTHNAYHQVRCLNFPYEAIINHYFGFKAMTKGAKLLEKEIINKDTGGQKEHFLE